MAYIQVRIDEKQKNAFESFCNNVGMNMSTAINLFITASLNEKKIPFEIKDNTTFSGFDIEKLLDETEKSENTKVYTVDEAFEEVNKIIEENNV